MTRNQWIAVAAGVFVVGFFLYGGKAMSMFKNSATGTEMSNNSRIATEVVYEDRIVGTGAVATTGSRVSVHYVGVFENGQKFDSSLDRGVPFQFTLGAGEVIKGWDQGVVGMKVGGRRIIVVPPFLGYGSEPRGPIPANSTLVFEIELLKVE